MLTKYLISEVKKMKNLKSDINESANLKDFYRKQYNSAGNYWLTNMNLLEQAAKGIT